MAVVFLFLRDWRATVVTAVALPLSIVPAFIVMDLLGFSLNTVRLPGITLVTGILADDAIVGIENIVRHIHGGRPAHQAAVEAAIEIGTTVIAISLTIGAVFAPMSFMPGIAGQDLKQFGITVAVAVPVSLLVARLITPMLAAYVLRSQGLARERANGPVMRGCLRRLGWTLRHRTGTLLAGPEIDDEIAARLAGLPDVRLFMLNENGQRDISINVLGDTEAAAARAPAQETKGVPDLRQVSTEAALARPGIQITPRPGIGAERGASAATLAAAIRAATLGDSDANLARFDAGEEQVPIRVRLEEAARDDLSRPIGLRVPSATGDQVPFAVLADVRLAAGPGVIERHDRRCRVAVEADLADGAALGPANQAIMTRPAATDTPGGTSLQAAGGVEVMDEVFASVALAMGAGVLLVCLVLVLLFGSVVTPVMILPSLPLAIGGAICALCLCGAGIGLSVAIGSLMLIWIVTRNAIMLVEFARDGTSRAAAMIDAGHKRARPSS